MNAILVNFLSKLFSKVVDRLVAAGELRYEKENARETIKNEFHHLLSGNAVSKDINDVISDVEKTLGTTDKDVRALKNLSSRVKTGSLPKPAARQTTATKSPSKKGGVVKKTFKKEGVAKKMAATRSFRSAVNKSAKRK